MFLAKILELFYFKYSKVKMRYINNYFYYLTLLLVLIVKSSIAEPVTKQAFIDSFHSHIEISPQGTVTTTETIKVYVDNKSIQHGIFRKIDLVYTDQRDIRHEIHGHFSSASVDGKSIPSQVSNRLGTLEIKLGDPSKFLVPGFYTYVLKYQFSNVLTFLQNQDEFFWNLTGSDWPFPIQHLSADIVLPLPAQKILKKESSMIIHGSFTGTYQVSISPNQVSYNFSSLPPHSGIAIILSFNKGFFIVPTPQNLKFIFIQNPSLIIGLGTLIMLIFAYLFLWIILDRDVPRKNKIFMTLPPENYSPMELQFIKMNISNSLQTGRIFLSALLNLAKNGYISIHSYEKKFIFMKTEKEEMDLLSEIEKDVIDELFICSNTFELIGKNKYTLKAITSNMLSKLRMKFINQLFYQYEKFSIFSLICLFIGTGLSYWMDSNMPPVFDFFIFNILAITILVLLSGAYTMSKERHILFKPFLMLSVVIIPMLILDGGMFLFVYKLEMAKIAIFTIILYTIFILAFIIRKPTPKTREILNQYYGFKEFLSSGYKHAILNSNLPELSIRQFEDYLPYAVALRVEKEWQLQFEWYNNKYNQNKIEYRPKWYFDSEKKTFDIIKFIYRLEKEFHLILEAPTKGYRGFLGGLTNSGGMSGGGGW